MRGFVCLLVHQSVGTFQRAISPLLTHPQLVSGMYPALFFLFFLFSFSSSYSSSQGRIKFHNLWLFPLPLLWFSPRWHIASCYKIYDFLPHKAIKQSVNSVRLSFTYYVLWFVTVKSFIFLPFFPFLGKGPMSCRTRENRYICPYIPPRLLKPQIPIE